MILNYLYKRADKCFTAECGKWGKVSTLNFDRKHLTEVISAKRDVNYLIFSLLKKNVVFVDILFNRQNRAVVFFQHN